MLWAAAFFDPPFDFALAAKVRFSPNPLKNSPDRSKRQDQQNTVPLKGHL